MEAQNLKRTVSAIVGAAERQPDQAPAIYARAAQAFEQRSKNTKDVQVARRLEKLANYFGQRAALPPPMIDDFQQRLRQTIEAYEQVGDNDLAVLARRNQLQEAAKPGGLRPPMTPPSFNPSSILGRTAVIKYAPTPEEKANGIVQSDGVALWQGDTIEAMAMTVDVNITSPPLYPIGADVLSTRAYGILKFGSDGNTTTEVKFDLGFGQRFTVVGNYISVVVGMDAPAPSTKSAKLTAGASIGAFSAPSQAPALLTLYADELANGDAATFPRPMRAMQLLPVQTTAAAGNMKLEFLNANGLQVLYQLTYPAGTLSAQPIPFTGDCGYIRLTNQTGVAADFRLPCQLSL